MSTASPLITQAEELANELAESLSAFLGRDVHFRASTRESRVFVSPADGDPLTVSVKDRQLLSLQVEYLCRFDHQQRFLAVHSSTIGVHAGARPKKEPLFRYEYVYDQHTGLPAAHLHVHAHRDQFTHLMTVASECGVKRRVADENDSVEVARLAAIHFPLGGHRFRPSLEDVLQLLEVEFGADVGESWPSRLTSARSTFRRKQTAAVVRDCPSEAITTLEEMGYSVTNPSDGPRPDRHDRLTAF